MSLGIRLFIHSITSEIVVKTMAGRKSCKPVTIHTSVNSKNIVGWSLGASHYVCEYDPKKLFAQQGYWEEVTWVLGNNSLEKISMWVIASISRDAKDCINIPAHHHQAAGRVCIGI